MKLQFHKKGIPVHIIKKIIVLIIIFIAALVFFEIITNHTEEVEISQMDEPTLPTIDISYLDDLAKTQLHGYTQEMDTSYMRDAIIPLDSTRNISLTVDCGDYKVDNLSYEICSLDTFRNISNNDISYTKSGDTLTGSFTAENLIDVGEEYLLILTLTSGDEEIYYYTRIMQTENCYESELVDFALYFHDTALSDDATELASYIEPTSGAANDSLYSVNINSSLSQINYADFEGSQLGDTYVTITDISTNYLTMTLSYEMTSGTERYPEYYTCSEDFRVRYTSDRIYLLNYNRTMEQLLTKTAVKVSDNLLNIGVRGEDVQYLSNETGTVAAFVQNGSLFEYDQTNQQLKQVFSFIGSDYTDTRAIYNQHEILILNIDESGTMDYVVYGYMNSGNHEGQCGINLFHYDSITDTSTEQVFISSSRSYQILNASFSDLLYETSDNEFYILVDNTLLHINLNDLTTDEVLSNLDDSQYAVSGSGRYLSWMDEAYISDAIHILDLETGENFDITAGSGQLLRPLNFMDEDIIYGIVNEADIQEDAAGSTIYPMDQIIISDISNSREQQLMDYSKTGYYVTDITIDSYTIYLSRITIDAEGTILEADSDTIKNSAGEQNKAVPITTETDDEKEKTVVLNMTELEDGTTIKKFDYDIPGLVLANGSRDVTVSTSTSSTQYFVYIGNKVTLATDDLLSSIETADENMGIVLDNEQRYIWKRGRKSYQNALTGIVVGSSDNEASGAARALSAMLVHEGENVQVHTLLESGDSVISILTSTLKDYTVLDLTGADLTQVLYYVSCGNPVYAMTGDDTAVLIVGYDSSSISYYDPLTEKTSKMTITDATTYFAEYGNVFVSYLQ